MKINQKIYLLFTPLLTAALVLLVYYFYGLYPFGDKSLAWCDMTQQSLPLMLQAGNLLSGETEGLYSLFTAGGMNLIGVFFFFVASPFTLLSPLVDGASFLLWANLLVLFKMMLASVTCWLWLDSLYHSRNAVIHMILSCSYALCGYNLMYYQNNIWMDIVYLFPIFMIYTLRLLRGKGRLGFICLLSLVIFTNYYISFEIILFLLFFSGIYLLVMGGQERKERILSLGFSTLCSLLLTAPVWLISFNQYLTSARGDDSAIGVNTLFPHLATTLGTFLPTALILGALFWITLLKKRTSFAGVLTYSLLLMLIPVIFDPINRIWHLGSYQAFPVRYGFIPILLALTLAAEASNRLRVECRSTAKTTPYGMIPLFFALGGAGFSIFLLNSDFKALTSYVSSLWVSRESFLRLAIPFLFCLLGYLFYFLCLKKKKISYGFFTAGMAFLMITEVLFSGAVYMGGAARNGTYFYWIDDLKGRIEEQDFYRVKTQKKLFDVNLLGAIGYPNLGHYTSLTTEDYLFTAKALGYSAYWMEVGGYGGSILSDLFLQNDYLIALEGFDNPFGEEVVYHSNAYNIWKQKYSLPIGAVVSQEITAYPSLPNLPRMQIAERLFGLLYPNQQQLVSAYPFTTIENLRHSVNAEDHQLKRKDTRFPSTIHYSLDITTPTALYYDCFDGYSNKLRENINSSISLYLNGEPFVSKYPSQNNNGLIALGIFENESVEIEVVVHKDFSAHSVGLFGVDLTALEEVIATQQDNNITLAIDGDTFSGQAFSPDDNSFMVLPFPYDEGFHLTVNGEDRPLQKVFGCFMAVPLSAGENHFTIQFTPKGLYLSLILFVAGILLMILIKHGFILKLFRPLGGIISFLFFLALLSAFLIVYLFPIIQFILQS